MCQAIFLILKVLEDSRQILVAANMQPDDPFPMDDKIKEGLTYFHTFFVSLYLDGRFSFAPSLLCHSHSDSVSTTSDSFVSCSLVTSAGLPFSHIESSFDASRGQRYLLSLRYLSLRCTLALSVLSAPKYPPLSYFF